MQLQQVGQAHQEAENAKKRKIQEEIEKKEKALRDAQARRARGAEAYQRERQLMFEKRELEEEMKKIERKKDVHFLEKQKAHINALNFRE